MERSIHMVHIVVMPGNVHLNWAFCYLEVDSYIRKEVVVLVYDIDQTFV